MSAVIAFDTLEFMDELKRSGMNIQEAESLTKATAKAFSQMMQTHEMATKKDLGHLEVTITKIINETMWKTIGIISTMQIISMGFFTFLQHLS
jgi:hypothetical protein